VSDLFPQPLAELAGRINAAHAAVESLARQSLDRAR
jgi:hypothetical protein